jgi:hypothetical protein
MRLLEIGTGDGALARALADAGYECSQSTRNPPEQTFVLSLGSIWTSQPHCSTRR